MADCVKVDVPLKWIDFVWALEQIRHKQNVSEGARDWFKLNPLDIVFLGCEALANNKDAIQKISNVVLSMENITEKLKTKPRIFSWIISLLVDLLSAVDTSSFIMQKVQRLLNKTVQICKDDFRLHFYLQSVLLQRLEERPTMEEAFLLFEEGVVIFRNIKDDYQMTLKDQEILSITDLKSLQILQLKILTEKFSFNVVQKLWKEFNFSLLIPLVTKSSLQESATMKLLFLLFGMACELSMKIENMAESLAGATTGTDEIGISTPLGSVPDITLSNMFRCILNFLRKCNQSSSQQSRIAYDLLEFICIQIATLETRDDFINMMQHLDLMLDLFFEHSLHGRLKASSEVLCGLLGFVAAGIETDITIMILLSVHLPNLLAIGFNLQDEKVTTLLLEYGALSFRSKYRKELVGTGLWYIKTVHKLFKSKEDIQRENEFIIKRTESVKFALDYIEFILGKACGEKEGGDNENSAECEEDQINHNSKADMFCSDDDDDEEDEIKRNNLLQLLLKVACCMVKRGDHVNYVFASVLPRLFQRTNHPDVTDNFPLTYYNGIINNKKSSIPWKLSKNKFTEAVLNLCVNCLENETSTPFQICSILIPKIVKNLDMTDTSATSKMKILTEFLNTCNTKLASGQGIEVLLAHGLDIISLLMPKNGNVEEVKALIDQVSQALQKLNNSTSLLMLKSSCEFMIQHFSEDHSEIKTLFLHLIQKRNRNDIRSVFLVSRPWLADQRFSPFRQCLYQFSRGQFKPKQLQVLVELLTSIAGMEEKLNNISKSRGVDDIGKYPMIYSLLKELLSYSCNFTPALQEQMKSKVAQLSLYFVLFQDETMEICSIASGEFVNIDAVIPKDISLNRDMMNILHVCGNRIAQMQIPRYEKLQNLLKDILREFIKERKIDVNSSDDVNVVCSQLQENEDLNLRLSCRMTDFDRYILSLPWNTWKEENLISMSYNANLWHEHMEVMIETDGQLNLEENLRQTLLSCYGEYATLLKQLGIFTITVDSKQVKIEDIFSDEHSLPELKGRRAIVIKTIDKNFTSPLQTRILEKKSALFLQEENIEKNVEEMARQPLKRRKFVAKLNTNFFDCARCCGTQIVGCYSPASGQHCERPLEIGYRVDSAFASIYNEENIEIENCELLFTDQGVYVFKAYSTGHPYDTSEVWMEFFVEILENKGLVPAIILPHHFPNRSTWEAIRRWVSPDITRTVITCDFDCSTEWITYYDSRPDCIGHGRDIILTKGFRNKERKTSFSFQRQVSMNTNKDLAGMVFEHVMEKLLEDEKLKKFRFLGKTLALFINDLIDNGRPSDTIFNDNFDYDRWIKSQKASSNGMDKQLVIQEILDFAIQNALAFLSEINLNMLLKTRIRQFLQMKSFLERNKSSMDPFAITTAKYRQLLKVLRRNLQVVSIHDLMDFFQKELMHWVFDNEDRVWRTRGGRDGHETLAQYLQFLKPKYATKRCFPGVLICVKRSEENILNSITVKDVVAYAVGEYVFEGDEDEELDGQVEKEENDSPYPNSEVRREKYYEIVTAWVDPRFRGLQLSTEMYLKTFKEVQSSLVVFDILRNSLLKVINSSRLLYYADKVGLSKIIIKQRASSYNVDLEGGSEQFEKLVIARKPLVTIISLVEWIRKSVVLLFSILFLCCGIVLYLWI